MAKSRPTKFSPLDISKSRIYGQFYLICDVPLVIPTPYVICGNLTTGHVSPPLLYCILLSRLFIGLWLFVQYICSQTPPVVPGSRG
uniref:Uncharacterized protein n=1 Tax=Engystomops pustulosus TaxID=76066 RepID=A0AAV6YWN2_ENGPU|nr:hypothetical protein GDO81_019601 [Engystomops pustulosus]